MAGIDLRALGFIAGIAGGLTGLIALLVNLAKWRWEARPDELIWEINEHYAIDVDNDRIRFPGIFQQQNPALEQTGILVKATFHGRHSDRASGT